MLVRLVFACALFAAAPALSQTAAQTAEVRRLLERPAVQKAVAALDGDHERWVAEVVTLTEIPAPPFKEAARAEAFAQMFREHGLESVEIDAEGNVLGLRRGTAPAGGPVVVVSAHLDTVFPEGTDVKVRREGDRLYAPGVGDDSAGLATVLSLVRAMDAAGVKTRRDVLFVGTVGEEGLGDLRGVRHLFEKGAYKDRIAAFFSLDSSGAGGIVNGAVGSKRYRVTFKGPGGHSYGAFGLVNPAAAMARAIGALYEITPPADPKTTYNVGVLSGGTSVNTIPSEVSMEVDMRSVDPAALADLERRFLRAVEDAAAAENAARSTTAGKIVAAPEKIGDRPAGRTATQSDLYGWAAAAARAYGAEPRANTSSTDANIPISRGVPALTLARSASGGRAHAPDEWLGIEKAANVKVRAAALATVLAAAGVR